MRRFFNHNTQSFYIDDINNEIPFESVEITEKQHNELYNAINTGCIIFDNLAYSDPKPSLFHYWDSENKKWEKNINAYQKFIYEQNTTILESLLNKANEKIAILQDILDLNMQKGNENEQLKSWKKYRILLIRIDLTQLNIKWPEQPLQ